MSYVHPGMPPVIRVTGETSGGQVEWQLESQSGAVVESYTTSGIDSPNDWWDDMANALIDSESRAEAAWDMMRFNALMDYEIIDDR